MSLFDLAPSNKISTSQIRLALVTRKAEIMKLYNQFPNVVGEEFYESALAEIDAFLLYIDGSKEITVTKDSEATKHSAIDFTLEELQEKIAGLPTEGYFKREKDQLWYYFICNICDQKIVEAKYEMLDMMFDGEWRAIASIDIPENLNLVEVELRYLVLA